MLAIASAIVLMAAAPGAADEDAGETYGLSPKHKTVPVQSREALAARRSLAACARANSPTRQLPLRTADRALLGCSNGKKDGLETGIDCECAAAG